MPDQPRQTNRFLGFAAGTPLLTPEGFTHTEEYRLGKVIQTQPDDQGNDKHDAHDDDQAGDGHRWWEEN